jgi:hypothetical protein
MMIYKDLEFRGIRVDHLGMYFEELGAKQITTKFPYLYKAANWSGEILAEEELAFTASFKVNCVNIRFRAANEEILTEIIKNYRYKTTRVGG